MTSRISSDLAPLPRIQFPYAVDLHFFIKDGDEYLCPQVSLKRIKRKSLANLLRSIRKGNIISGNLLRRSIASVYRYGFKYFYQPMRMKSYVDSGIGDTYVWFIPESLIRAVKKVHTG